MALSFTVSYTFAPSTTISSSQVNTNTNDVANVFNGLEAKTKTFSNLGVDTELKSAGTIKSADGTAAAPGFTFTSNTAAGLSLSGSSMSAINLNALRYRRPGLQFGTTATVAVEASLDGTSGNIPIIFPDGSMRTETTSTRTTFDITRNTVLVTSGAQSGLRATLSEATNTWYALYAVKVTDSSTLWCTVGDTRLPLQANYSDLNTAFGTNGWVYLGLIRNGDNSGATGDILTFVQHGHQTLFRNVCSGSAVASTGTRLANTAAATTITYTYAAGTGATDIPGNVLMVQLIGTAGAVAGTFEIGNAAGSIAYVESLGNATNISAYQVFMVATGGCRLVGANTTHDILLTGFIDNALGLGANTLL